MKIKIGVFSRQEEVTHEAGSFVGCILIGGAIHLVTDEIRLQAIGNT